MLEKGTHNELLEANGYYASLVKSQKTQYEMDNQNNYEEKLNEKLDIERKRTEEEINFEARDNAISLSEKDIAVRPCAIITELSDYKFEIFLACLGALIVGVITPVIGFSMAKTSNALSSIYETVRYDDGLKYAFLFLAFSVLP